MRNEFNEGIENRVARAAHECDECGDAGKNEHQTGAGIFYARDQTRDGIDESHGLQAGHHRRGCDDEHHHFREAVAHAVEKGRYVLHGGFHVAAADGFRNEGERKGKKRDFNEPDLRVLEAGPEEDRKSERQHGENGVPRGRVGIDLAKFRLIHCGADSAFGSVEVLLPEIMHDAHHDDRRNGDDGVMVKDIVDHMIKTEHTSCDYIVSTQRRRHNGCRCGNDAGSGERRHLGGFKHRIERCHQNHGKRRSARDDDGEERPQPEHQGHQDVGRLHGSERAAQKFDHLVVGADFGHVGSKAEKRQDDETRVGVLLDEKILDGLKGIRPGESGGIFARQNVTPHDERGVHQEEAGRKEHDFGIVVFGNRPAGEHEDENGEDSGEHDGVRAVRWRNHAGRGQERSAHDEKRKAAILSQIDWSLKCGEIMKRVIVYPGP